MKRATDVLSSQFTDWDKLPRGTETICRECEWAYQILELRTGCLLLTEEEATILPREKIADVLLQPFSLHQSATIPLTGRKHLLPSAEWGAVSSDMGTFTWDAAPAALAVAVKQLRRSNATDDVLVGKDFLASGSLVADPRLWKALDVVRSWEGTPHLSILVKVSRSWQPAATMGGGGE